MGDMTSLHFIEFDHHAGTALEGGAEAILTKPIDFVTLRNEIDTRVEQAA
jgi:hypothetical protein